MKNKIVWKLIAWYSSSIIFLVVGSIFAAAAADKWGNGNNLLPVGFAVLFFFLFAIALGMAFYYTFSGNNVFKKKSSDTVKIDEIQKIEPITEE